MTGHHQQRGRAPAVDASASKPIALTNKSFTEILGLDLKEEHRGGILRVTGQIIDVPPGGGEGKGITYDFAVIDVRIVGMLGSTSFSLHRGIIGADAGPLDLALPFPSPWKRLQVLARLQINGDDSFAFSSNNKPVEASAAAQVRMAHK